MYSTIFNKALALAKSFILLVLICFVLELLIFIYKVPKYILPSPSSIFIEIITHIEPLAFHTFITFLEALLGFILANLLGLLTAILFSMSRTLERNFFPIIITIKATPIIAITPLLIMWLGNGMASKIVTAALISFFPAVINNLKGLRSVSDEYLDLFKIISATPLQTYFKLRLPASLPYFFSSLKISSSLSVVGALVGEFIGSDKGLGYLIMLGSYYIDMPGLFSAVICSSLLAILFFAIISEFEKRLVFWK